MTQRAEAAVGDQGPPPGQADGPWWRNPAILLLAVAVLASGTTVLILVGDVIFLRDEWSVALDRRGVSAGVFLDPFVGHLAAALIAIYKLLLATFGMSSPLPFHVVSTLIYLLAAVLLFVYARRRVGDWLALLGTVVILFFGASAADILSPFQMFFSGAIAAGIGALLALDRDDRRGDVIACLLSAVSIAFGEAGVAFAIGVLVRVALSRRPLVPRLYVALVPLFLYGLWWLGWGHTAESYVTWHNVATTPTYALDAASAAIASLTGLANASDALPTPVGQQWLPAAFIAAIALAAWRIRILGRVPPGIWPVLAIGLTFWGLAGLNQFFGFRAPGNGRYLYPSAVFVLLIASELLRGVRVGRVGMVAAVIVTGAGLAANLTFLNDGYKSYFKPANEQQRGAIAALDIAGPDDPSFVLTAKTSPVTFFAIDTGRYLSAVDAFGSPAYTDAELAAAPESSRAEADRVFAAVLGLKLEPGGSPAGPCRTVPASPGAQAALELGPGKVTLASGGGADAEVKLGRFSDDLPVDAGSLQPGSRASITIPADRSDRPWRLGLQGEGRTRVCGAGLGGGLR